MCTIILKIFTVQASVKKNFPFKIFCMIGPPTRRLFYFVKISNRQRKGNYLEERNHLGSDGTAYVFQTDPTATCEANGVHWLIATCTCMVVECE